MMNRPQPGEETIIISILNLKGGVAKTISAVNIAHVLAEVHGYRVLLIDNDKQGNTSRFFGVHGYSLPTVADVLTFKADIKTAIRETAYDRLHVLPANMNLLKADREILIDSSKPQQTRLRKALRTVAEDYDFVVIDNAPDLSMSVINGLVACHDVLIPIKVDSFAFEGVDQVQEQVEDIREFNERIQIKGCFVTMYQRNGVNIQGEEYLSEKEGLHLFKTVIRKTVRVDETTYNGMPLLHYAKNSTAAQDYVKLVAEYLGVG